jgi:branched-chain amino acid transport system ATP-binding protein
MGAKLAELEARATASIPRDDGAQNTRYRLSTENIAVQFGGVIALADVRVSIRREEILGLIGPNGAGKTTLVNCMTGFQRPTFGRVLLDEKDYSTQGPESFRRAGVARTFQAGRLFREMSVLDNVMATAVGMGLSLPRAAKAAIEILTWLGVGDKASQLAGVLPYTD